MRAVDRELTDWQEQGHEPMTRAQQKLLNAACGDLAEQMLWHGFTFTKDQWRHFFAGVVLGNLVVPAWDFGDGRRGVVMMSESSLSLTKSLATEAIEMAFLVGDYPEDQMENPPPPVRWCAVICLCRWVEMGDEP